MPTETQAWVVEKESGPFVLHDVTLDDPLEDEVLVQLSAQDLDTLHQYMKTDDIATTGWSAQVYAIPTLRPQKAYCPAAYSRKYSGMKVPARYSRSAQA